MEQEIKNEQGCLRDSGNNEVLVDFSDIKSHKGIDEEVYQEFMIHKKTKNFKINVVEDKYFIFIKIKERGKKQNGKD